MTNLAAVMRGGTEFARHVYSDLAVREQRSFVFSPLGLYIALSMTHAGAGGRTEAEMGAVLGFFRNSRIRLHAAMAPLLQVLDRPSSRGSTELLIAKGLWPQVGYPVLEDFRSFLRTGYNAEVHPVDYRQVEQAQLQINKWAAENTAGEIQDFVGSDVLDVDTRLLAVNAIYFKGTWATQFDRTLTATRPFWVTENRSVSVDMMNQTADVGYVEVDNLKVLELGYLGSLSMVFVLPNEQDGLAKCERDLTAKKLGTWIRMVVRRRVHVSVPKLRIESKFYLRESLISMGMKDAFDISRADFSRMVAPGSPFFLTEVIQKAFVEINEDGAQAAAVSASIARTRSAFPIPSFCADHPFLLLIRDQRTGMICFLGRFVLPD